MNILPSGAVLYIDTTAANLQLALSLPNKAELLSVCLPCDSHRYHSARLTPALNDLLVETGIQPTDLAGLVVNIGPGSFTGVRTGVVTTRTLAQFLPISVYTCNTLELWAWLHFEAIYDKATNPVAVYLDAFRGRAFHAVYDVANASDRDHLRTLIEPSLTVLATAARSGMTLDPSTTPLILPLGTLLMAPASLHPLLENRGFELLPPVENPDTPRLMQSLLSHSKASHLTPWEDVLPLYLQEPSITLKPGFIPPTVGLA
jgi:tRNA threonylcarbamoyl adenosine modification protein YeaZ